MGGYTIVLVAMGFVVLLPWIIVGAVALIAREHFRARMPWYIGCAFAFEFLLIFLLFAPVSAA